MPACVARTGWLDSICPVQFGEAHQGASEKREQACPRMCTWHTSSLAIHADRLQMAVSRLNVGLNALVGRVSIGGDAAVGGLVVLVLLHL